MAEIDPIEQLNGGPVVHRNDEYDPTGFEILAANAGTALLVSGSSPFPIACRAPSRRSGNQATPYHRIGGGCGGWLTYLERHKRFPVAELAIADSSPDALEYAAGHLATHVGRYQVDLLDLPWTDRWDLAFLLDVIEHVPDHQEALRQVYRALAPGGLLFVTTPALKMFWSWNDEVARHLRRYSKTDYRHLAAETGFTLADVRYFMFFLSPLLWAARRVARPNCGEMSSRAGTGSPGEDAPRS